jgi:hypothetical protein
MNRVNEYKDKMYLPDSTEDDAIIRYQKPTPHLDLEEYPFDKTTMMGGWYIKEDLVTEINKWINDRIKSWDWFQLGDSIVNGVPQHAPHIKEAYQHNVNPDMLDEPWGQYRDQLQGCLELYMNKYPEMCGQGAFDIYYGYNVQVYKKGGGFKIWHAEYDYLSDVARSRALVFMTYLMDIEDGGTHFKYQNITCPSKQGLTVLWPPYWTHTHKSEVSHTSSKRILTGWYNHKL